MAIILITGSKGQLGSELNLISKNFSGYDFLFTDIESLDITDKDQTADFIKKNKPDWIVNCAAYNLVDKAESESGKAFRINAEAVSNITESIKGSECKFIHVSTDYVFDGRSNIPYNEDSEVNPLSAYGRSKSAGEKEALRHHAAMIIRTSWLYSFFGNNFVKTIRAKAQEKDILKVVFDQTGSPTCAADLAEAIMGIIAGVIRNRIAFTAGIYNYSNEGVCSWYDLAEATVYEAGIQCKILPILSKDYPTVAQRPFYSVLDKSKIKETFNLEIPHWRSSLRRCIKLLNDQ